MGTGTDGRIQLGGLGKNRDLWEKLCTVPGVHISTQTMINPGHHYLTATYGNEVIANGHTYFEWDGENLESIVTAKSSYTLTPTAFELLKKHLIVKLKTPWR